MEKDFESIREKLRKLQVLAERGENGEARNARAAIERLCRQYGISVGELMEDEKRRYRFSIGGTKVLKDLFWQCYCKVLNTDKLRYWKTPFHSEVELELTRLQYVELSSLWDWHEEHFKTELEKTKQALLISYIRKHGLYSESTDSESGRRELTEKEKAALLRSMLLDSSLSDEVYQKQLEAKR